jgi:hypothetical protein
MSGNNSTGAGDAPNRAIRKEETLGAKIEGLPKTVLFFLFSFSFILAAVVLDAFGFVVLAAVIAAIAVVFMALAIITHAVYVLLGRLD